VTVAITAVEAPDDPRLDDYRHLIDVDRRQAVEIRGGFFIAEGRLVIARLLESAYPIRSFLVSEPKLPVLRETLDGRDPGVPIYVATQAVMEQVAGFPIHRGLLAAATRVPLEPLADLVRGERLLVVLEDVNDHENMGAIFRNAAALGAGAAVLDPRCCDPLYRRSVRVSTGHVFQVPFSVARQWPAELAVLKREGFTVVALTPADDAMPLSSVSVDGPVAVMLGAEGPGLSPEALAAADRRVRIPMVAGIDSLNVATATAIALYHFAGVVAQ
jgi:tRNA G18 (ribose-2'-O)-methylase SpoU